MDCNELQSILDSSRICEQSDFGAKVLTHCLYPSADPVFVHVSKFGDGYRLTDGGGVARCVLNHGRDDHALESGLKEASNRHALKVENGLLFADAPSIDWLPAAVAAVANGSALAASIAIEHVTRKAERGLATRIFEELRKVVPQQSIAKGFDAIGKSGKHWHVDYAIVTGKACPLLIKAITPHHNSISANYTAFGDIGREGYEHFCVYQRRLDQVDAALIRQVATLVPVSSLETGAKEALHLLN